MNTSRVVVIMGLMGLVGAHASGCSSRAPVEGSPPTVVEYRVKEPPGVVEYIWEEPMVDVVDVPPGLDPEGHYYRPGHQEVTEIRQGRWQYYKKPNR